MPTVVPFKAWRPRKTLVREIAAYPYDVVDDEEARRLVGQNALSFLRVEKSEVDLPPGIAPDDPRIFATARENLHNLIRENALVQEPRPCFYVYVLSRGDHVQRGIVAGLSVSEYEAGKIKKHESTTVYKETERIKNIDTANAQTGLTFLVYRAREAINRILAEITRGDPEYDFVFDNGVTHRVWVVGEDRDIRAIENEFLKVDAFYIADGHHRAAAAVAVARMRREKNPTHQGREAYNFFMGALFPHDQVKILDYNRMVNDLNGLSEERLLDRIRERFTLSAHFKEKSPQRPHQLGMYLRGKWYKLDVREDLLSRRDAIGRLDVSLLQDFVLTPVLGIQDPRTDQRIKFVGGIRGVEELERRVDSGEFAVAFSMYPTSVDQLMEVADAGRVMPPKSTWFEPKLLSGIFVHSLD